MAKPAYSDQKNVVVSLEVTRIGQLSRAVPLGTQRGNRLVGVALEVPERVKRASGDNPNFLCDNVEYLLGVRPGTRQPDERSRGRKRLCLDLHQGILRGVEDDGAHAVLAFLSRATEELIADPKLSDSWDALDGGGNIVFRLDGDDRYIHERPAIKRAWEAHKSESGPDTPVAQCLVTGEYGPIARLHKSTSEVVGAQSSGASLVSFNFGAAESYGKEQGDNSPVSERAAFAYGTALNWLTSSERHHVLAGDTTVVFWAEKAGPEEDLLLDAFGAAFGVEGQESANDEPTARKMKGVLERLFRGQMPTEAGTTFDHRTRFYILGLAPNAARLSVRFWNVDTFGGVLKNLCQHFEDMAMVHRESERPISVPQLLLEMAPAAARKREAVPKVLVGSLMRSILEGTAYPQSLYAALISRTRVDSNDPDKPWLERKVNYPRAAFIRAHLRRNARIAHNTKVEEGLTEVLNTENKNPGYLLGRVFALLEKAQQDANPLIKATIKDRYYASASATPRSVFPVLIRLSRHHLAKSEYGGYVDKLIEDVMVEISDFPAHMNLDQQGLFALGYYQQRNALYKKAESEQKGGEEHDESR